MRLPLSILSYENRMDLGEIYLRLGWLQEILGVIKNIAFILKVLPIEVNQIVEVID